MLTNRFGWLLVFGCASYACSPIDLPADASLGADAEPVVPSEPTPDAAQTPAADAEAGADAGLLDAAMEAGPTDPDAGPSEQTPDATTEIDAAVDADAAPAVDPDAGPTDPDAVVPMEDPWVFNPDALRTAKRRTVIGDIPEAENMFFTEDGRLFVSGGESVFEIKRDASGAFTKTDLFHENCLVEGITQTNGYIYGVCTITDLAKFGQAFLLGGKLTDEPRMEIIGRLDDLSIPNGLDVDRNGNIFTTYYSTSVIAKLVLSDPMKLARVEVWAKDDLFMVNGLRIIGDYVYVTSMDLLSLSTRYGRLPVRPDGKAGKPEFLLSRALTVFDDLNVFEDGQMLTDFLNGTVAFLRNGKVVAETPKATFVSPTAVLQGKPPMFRRNQLLVTEKGELGVRNEVDGDRLSVIDL